MMIGNQRPLSVRVFSAGSSNCRFSSTAVWTEYSAGQSLVALMSEFYLSK